MYMRIGIFGGAFNPPHIGHVGAAKAAAEQYELDLLLVIPTGTPPHKQLPPNTPDAQMRLQMTRDAFCKLPFAKVSDMEIFSRKYNYTIDTVALLEREYPGAQFFLPVGTDMYETLSSWKDSDALLKIVTPVVLSRAVVDISSSELREMLPQRKGCEFILDLNYSFIIRHRLYDAKPDWDWLRKQAYSMLDARRIPHVTACEAEAVRLAEHWGADPDDAREAAILHDITKKLDFSENMCIISKHGMATDMYNVSEEKLLHSITGALLAQSEFGVSDAVFDAIKWHTTGRAGMSLLEKVIYIADYIESTRDFNGVKALRKLAYESIDDAMISGLEMTVSDLKSRGIAPDIKTNEAIASLVLRKDTIK